MMDQEKAYSELAACLRERLRIIGDVELRSQHPDRQLAQLQAVSEAIEDWHQRHAEWLPNSLVHYLQRASFDKALAWIESGGSLRHQA